MKKANCARCGGHDYVFPFGEHGECCANCMHELNMVILDDIDRLIKSITAQVKTASYEHLNRLASVAFGPDHGN